ncbi:MAG: class I SAM-dependent methyltransferase [Spirosomataceae bacterium]
MSLIHYRCPKTGTPLTLSADGNFLHNQSDSEPIQFEIRDGIPDLCFPLELFEADRKEQEGYNNAYLRYDRGVSWVFESLNNADETATRQFMVSLLGLKPGMKVLEVGAGTGKDSALIVEQISPGGTAYLSDLSPNMLKLARQKLHANEVDIHFFIANASYLPFADETFDAVFHFGGINTFSEVEKAFFEMTRVTKKGGKVVVGDESVANWLRDEFSYQTLMKANPMFDVEVPLKHLPKNADNVQLNWIFGNAFYVLSYTVGAKAPEVNIDLPIPGKDFVDTWRIRAEKKNS